MYTLDLIEPFEKFDLTFDQYQKCLEFVDNYFIQYDSPCSIGDVEDFINEQFYNNEMAFALRDYSYGWYPGDIIYDSRARLYMCSRPLPL